MTDLESAVVLTASVGLHLAGDEELSCGGSHCLGSRDELLLLRLALHDHVGCFAQGAGGRGNQFSLGEGGEE